jgi:hypothetical protein
MTLSFYPKFYGKNQEGKNPNSRDQWYLIKEYNDHLENRTLKVGKG